MRMERGERTLGISDHYISGAAIIDRGQVLAAVAEERLARMKMVMGFPRLAIAEVLRMTGTTAADLDRVVVASEWGHFLDGHVDFSGGVFGVEEGWLRSLFFAVGSRLSGLRSRLPILERLYFDLRKPAFARRRDRIRAVLRDEFGFSGPVEFVPHHLAHAAGAFLASGFGEGLVVTLDGAGDGDSSHVYDVRDGKWTLLHAVPSFDSLGDYYGYVTQISGFKAGKHEGKITGLAASGEPRYRDVLDRFIRFEGGSIVNVGNTFRHAALRKLRRALPSDFSREDLAASMQSVAEDIATRYVAHWREKTGHTRIALAGGVFANVKVNQRIHEIEGVESVFVYPAMSDEGIAAGAALWHGRDTAPSTSREGEPRRCFDQVYLGPEYTPDEIRAALKAGGVDFTQPEDPVGAVADLLARGFVVARFAGRMEYGPRALGNRSILYRPDEPSVNDWLNGRLGRTEFMPFAPAVLWEDAPLYFEGLPGAEDAARFMTITFNCTPLMRERCPGVVHIDGTARPQLVRESDNPSYYAIIREFKRLTGLSCIVNTSFNIHEEPIVCTPDDAVRAFRVGHLDALAIGPFLAMNPAAESERVRRSEPDAMIAGGA
ncbi:MAG: carbamoyltransferase [Gemmatimonadales bacterium]|nr:MAG: carbamoyltransferase [Gemmatimonadales bacterium]